MGTVSASVSTTSLHSSGGSHRAMAAAARRPAQPCPPAALDLLPGIDPAGRAGPGPVASAMGRSASSCFEPEIPAREASPGQVLAAAGCRSLGRRNRSRFGPLRPGAAVRTQPHCPALAPSARGRQGRPHAQRGCALRPRLPTYSAPGPPRPALPRSSYVSRLVQLTEAARPLRGCLPSERASRHRSSRLRSVWRTSVLLKQ